MYCYSAVLLCLFKSFRRDLNETQAVYIAEYYLVFVWLSLPPMRVNS